MVTHKHHLSVSRQKLVLLMSQLNFGHIRNLEILQGEPVLGPTVVTVEDVKLDGQRVTRTEVNLTDFALKEQHLILFQEMDRVGSGHLEELTIRHGLPCRFLLARQGVA